MVKAIKDGAVTLYHDGDIKAATTSTGIDVTGVITTDGLTTSADINFGDSDKAVFGAGSDLSIYHDGSNSIIKDAGTGGLHIRASANLQLQDADGYLYVNCIDGGNGGTTKLYNLNQEKLATTSSGIDVTGNVTATAFYGDGSNLTGVSSTTINNNADNRIITGSGTANTLNAESGLTYDGSTLSGTNIQMSNNINASGVTANNISGVALQINGTTVINSSRNLTNIGTINSGSITVDPSGTYGDGITINAGDNSSATQSAKQIIMSFGGSSSIDYPHSIRTRHNAGADTGNTVEVYLWDYGTDSSSTIGTKRALVLENSTGLDLLTGGYRVGGTTVIDSSRNLTNIGGISATGTGTTPFTFAGTSTSLVHKIGSATQTSYASTMWETNDGLGQIWKTGSTYTAWGGADALNIYNSNGSIAFHPSATANVLKLTSTAVNATQPIQISGTTVIDSSRNIFTPEIELGGDAEHKLRYSIGSIISGGTTHTTILQGRQVDIYGYDDIQIRAGSTDKIVLTASGLAKIQIDANTNILNGILQIGGSTFADQSRNITAGTINSGRIAATNGIEAQGIWINNNQPSANNAIYSGYGAIGNRGTFYITNGGGNVQIGNGATHNSSSTATFGTTGLNMSAGKIIEMNGTTVIDSSRNLTNIGTISSGNIISTGEVRGATLRVQNTSNTTKYGLTLYGASGTNPTYGIMFTGTSGSGTHGSVTGDWATYFTMNGSTNRGWIFREQTTSTNVASISNTGNATFNGTITSGAITSTGDISGATIEGYVFPSYPSQSGGLLRSDASGNLDWTFNTVSSYVDSGDNRVVTSTGSTGIQGEYGLTYSRTDGLQIHNYNGTGGLSSDATLTIGKSNNNSGISELILDSQTSGFIKFQSGTTTNATVGYTGVFTNKMSITCSNGITFGSSNLETTGTISSGAITLSHDSSDMGFGTAKAGSSVGHSASVDEGIFWHTSNDYGIFRTAGGWSSPNYQQLKLKWATGIEIDGNGTTYGKSGINFLNGNIKMDGTQILDASRNLTNIGTISSGAINTSAKVTISNANYNQHLEISRTGQGTLSLTPSANQLLLGGGGFSPSSNNAYDLGRSDKYWQDLWLGTSLKMGGTTVIDSSRNINCVNFENTGGAKLEVQDSVDGGNTRGIFMWNSSDTNWGFYMSTAGAGKALDAGTACSGLDGRTSHGIRYRVADSTTQIGHIFENASDEALFQIQPDTGNIFARGNVTAYASDARLKTNIKIIENPIEKIKKIRGVEFDWIDNIEETHQFKPKCKRETGVIAQEIEEVIPDAISPAPFNNEYKTVEKDKIVALLIEAIKDQQKQIDELKVRLDNDSSN